MRKLLLILFLSKLGLSLFGEDIERFEHLDTRNGLSQNAVLSMYCDHLGQMWFGTMDGLNLYNGYTFKIYKAIPGEERVLTNNRIIDIKEDPHNFLWVKTHDGFLHYLDQRVDKFTTFPYYQESEEEKNSEINFFCQAGDDEIWLGGTKSGVYHLKYNSRLHDYDKAHFVNRGINHITNNSVQLLFRDSEENIWIGTSQGLNLLTAEDYSVEDYNFQHLFVDVKFTVATQLGRKVYFGTENRGIIEYNLDTEAFSLWNTDPDKLKNASISVLQVSKDNMLIIGTENHGLFIHDPVLKESTIFLPDEPGIRSIFEDYYGDLWVNSVRFGIFRLEISRGRTTYFTLTPPEIVALVDNERQYLYEDSNHQLWIGLHGAGLALFKRDEGDFQFYRNDPENPNSISSNFIHCITEDMSGLLWVGTGQFNGGINKVIYANPAFKQVVQKARVDDKAENVVRSLLQDSNGNIWVATKSGKVYVYDTLFALKADLGKSAVVVESLKGSNVYTMMQDHEGYLWLGSKGGGVTVSSKPLSETDDYCNLQFNHYMNKPDVNTSLSSNFVYSLAQDHEDSIWIGTYGGGLLKVISRNSSELRCRRYAQSSTNLSSNEVRQVYIDRENRIWAATTFGLDLFKRNSAIGDSMVFSTYSFNPLDSGSISYNDIIHIFQDSRDHIWLGTFGGGVNLVENIEGDRIFFTHFNKTKGLINDAVFGIIEDDAGFLWFSTENGISRMNPNNRVIENYDKNNGLLSAGFSENTCLKMRDGRLLFGTNNGVLIISPDKLRKFNFTPPVILTNFQLNNRDLDINDEDSPIRMNIEFLDEIELAFAQNSFSIEYAALNFFDPDKNKYSFILENFEDDWNDLGTQRKATYTNISPGTYIFKVRAANADGSWDSSFRSLTIHIKPPWFRTRLAYGIYFVIILMLFEITRRILTKYNHMRNDLKVERRVNEIKLQFFTNISHEIRTPLTLILGPLDDLLSENLPQKILKPVEVIQRNGKKMLRLVNQLLDFRKIQNNKMNLKVRETDIVAFAQEIFENFEYLAKQREIDYRFSSEVDSFMVWIDQEKIDIVLFNLLSNAFKFTSRKKDISLQLALVEDRSILEIIVEDKGRGIPSQKLPMLFERFNSLTFDAQGFSGTGIGLALSRELVRLHKGDIFVSSVENEGSKFTVRILTGSSHFEANQIVDSETDIPLIHYNEALVMEEELAVKTDANEKKDMPTLLIIEDNPEILSYIAECFAGAYVTITASNGEEGLTLLRNKQVDLVITDIMMPVMDGITFTRIVKDDFEVSHIPVVMLTAKSGLNDQIDGIESGAEAYVLKPFNARFLKAVVSGLIKQRGLIFDKMAAGKEVAPGRIKITSKDKQFLDGVLRIIDENYTNPEFNVEKMVEQSSVGRTVFYNKIKGLTDLSPVEFLRQMRLKIAVQFLESSDYNVTEIAYMVGFNDEKYFRKCFKLQFGSTPSEFRKNILINKDKEDNPCR